MVNAGEIVEQGSHDELMAQKGFYYALYMSQFKGKAPAAPRRVQPYSSPPDPRKEEEWAVKNRSAFAILAANRDEYSCQ